MGGGADPVYDGVGHDSRRNSGSHAGALRADERGNAIDVRDPLSDKIRTIVNASSDIDRVPALLGLSEVFGHDLAHNRVFVEAVSQAYQRITRHGARQAVIETLNI